MGWFMDRYHWLVRQRVYFIVLSNSTPQNGYLRVSTMDLLFIGLLEALNSENMERLLKDSSKN